ncbi:angiotensin-converting enzyme [Rhagoletis pomonella]|uniref:angiotensin-converting enzyme n=1 Tax=Rhagoletis pomonella TaxID=28610 RepID=UPI0017849417|nr:angiotensin-converting enzyme [Rhagoletis pomonella]XP_036321246.1 angiotensin-converting enzyme [Rhagoletis pomonella]XP_036321247.1 angiotensin-converting enzyme [Rhagoletis pomonella]
MRSIILLTFLLQWQLHTVTASENSTAVLTKFLANVNQNLAGLYNREVFANWQLEIKGPNDLYAILQSELASEEIMKYIQSIAAKCAKFKRLKIGNEQLQRELAQVPETGYEALPATDLKLMYIVTTNMGHIYKNTKLCAFHDRRQCNLTLIPAVQNILHNSDNVSEIEYYWLEWRRKTGMAAKEDFATFVELYRKTAQLNGFATPSEFWFKDLEEDGTQAASMLAQFMQRLQPLLQQFHAHVRGQLRRLYGEELIPRYKPVPQNLAEIFIGNAYRRADPEWYIEFPYPEVGMPNITEGLLRRGLNNAQRVFWNVADYFRSLGMPQIEDTFWSENARPKADLNEESMRCWHKAWKFYGIQRVNFSYCPSVDEERFFNMFEALTDLYYYRAYEEQPTLFAEEPFPNFSDALGKMFSLAASSPRYLEKLKALDRGLISKELRINRLYWQGLRTIFLLPIFYVLDRYRVDVLDGRLNISDNCAYWQLTSDFTGAEPPVIRSNEDFDAPAKLLVEVDDQYTSQIMSTLLQYQLYKHFCEISGQYKPDDPNYPLDLCDLSDQRQVGPLVWQAMSFGSSQSYKDILHIMTNETAINMEGLLAYYQPLYDWLVEQNRLDGVEIGWEPTTKCSTEHDAE